MIDGLRIRSDGDFKACLIKEMRGRLRGMGNQRLDEALPDVKTALEETYMKSFERTADQAQEATKS